MAWRRPGDKPLSEPMMVSLLTHICVTRPQWVKCSSIWLYGTKAGQEIIWTNVDILSVRSFGIHLRAVSQDLLIQISILDMSLKITTLRLQPHISGANESIAFVLFQPIGDEDQNQVIGTIGNKPGMLPGKKKKTLKNKKTFEIKSAPLLVVISMFHVLYK